MKPSEIKAKTDTRLKTENTSQHTLGEWFYLESGGFYNIQDSPYYEGANLLDEEECSNAKANAQRIVKAVNMHDELLEFIKDSMGIFASEDYPNTYERAEELLKQASQK